MFTVEVVLPTPPFWLATTITRVFGGRGSGSLKLARSLARNSASIARASGVEVSPYGAGVPSRSAAVLKGTDPGSSDGVGYSVTLYSCGDVSRETNQWVCG